MLARQQLSIRPGGADRLLSAANGWRWRQPSRILHTPRQYPWIETAMAAQLSLGWIAATPVSLTVYLGIPDTRNPTLDRRITFFGSGSLYIRQSTMRILQRGDSSLLEITPMC